MGCERWFSMPPPRWACGELMMNFTKRTLSARNVLAACQDANVGKVIFTGRQAWFSKATTSRAAMSRSRMRGVSTSHYSRTKALAEEMVRARDSERLPRFPCGRILVWGPGANHIVSQVLERGRCAEAQAHRRLEQEGGTRPISMMQSRLIGWPLSCLRPGTLDGRRTSFLRAIRVDLGDRGENLGGGRVGPVTSKRAAALGACRRCYR